MEYFIVFFFFQAEDGIRDIGVTGVQTCALPISGVRNGVRGSRVDRVRRAEPPPGRREEDPGMASLFSKLTQFANTPKGRQVIAQATEKAQQLAKDPKTRRSEEHTSEL